ncbi:signal recognition particle receptor subunit alpha homolog [Babesia caballi]|uniref:Signal recognition particle receptor subunit alpha homolog n=1 Tax=Babesia caballi TaxID=5871 RepID=A0AAV4LMV0_BABCB|nr:signal recognition particle receptor subunit alpha homolog [Babesia caballi]
MYGSGAEGLRGVANQVGNLFQKVFNWGGVDSFLKQIGKAFKDHLGNGMQNQKADNVAGNVGEYLKEVFNGTKKWKGDADQAAEKLQALVQKFKSNNTYNTNDNSFSQNVKSVETALKPGSHSTVRFVPCVWYCGYRVAQAGGLEPHAPQATARAGAAGGDGGSPCRGMHLSLL